MNNKPESYYKAKDAYSLMFKTFYGVETPDYLDQIFDEMYDKNMSYNRKLSDEDICKMGILLLLALHGAEKHLYKI